HGVDSVCSSCGDGMETATGAPVYGRCPDRIRVAELAIMMQNGHTSSLMRHRRPGRAQLTANEGPTRAATSTAPAYAASPAARVPSRSWSPGALPDRCPSLTSRPKCAVGSQVAAAILEICDAALAVNPQRSEATVRAPR